MRKSRHCEVKALHNTTEYLIECIFCMHVQLFYYPEKIHFQRIAKHDSMFFTFNGEEFKLPKKKRI